MKRAVGVAGIVAFALIPSAVCAHPSFETKYVYYTIKGKSAPDLYNSMIAKGPKVNGAKAYASTSASSSQQGKLMLENQCRIVDYKFSINFTIHLPRLNNERNLKPVTRKRWESFSQFLRKHEETHRAIWLGCAQELEDRVKTLRSDNCDEIDKETVKLWDEIQAECNVKHDAFDAAEQKRLAAHPFVQLVIQQAAQTRKTSSKSNQAAKAATIISSPLKKRKIKKS